MKITTSEAHHQCQAKVGSTNKVEIGYSKNIGGVCKRKLEISKLRWKQASKGFKDNKKSFLMLAVRELFDSLVLTVEGKLSECQDASHAEWYYCFKMLTASRWGEQLKPEKRV